MELKSYLSGNLFFLFSLLILLNNLQLIKSTDCVKNDAISNTACFNDILIK